MTQSEESITLDDALLSSLITVTDPSHSFRMTPYRPSSLRTGQKKNLHSILLRHSPKPVSSVRLRRPPPYKQGGLPNPYSFRQNPFPQHGNRSFTFVQDDALTFLYKDHGVGRQKELLAHVVRLRILACRNNLNRKRIVSL